MKGSTKRTVPGINIQYPWSQLLMSRLKTIETRFYRLPKKYTNTDLAVIETPGKNGHFKARIIGTIVFSECVEYTNKKSFSKDFEKHKIGPDSDFYWTEGKRKWAWIVSAVQPLKKPIPAPSKRGIIWTASVAL